MSLNNYLHRLHLAHSTVSRIEHDDSMVAIVYKITQPEGRELILKICPRAEDYLREVYFLQYFANKLPVPRVLQLIAPEAGIDGAILMEYLPGSLLKIPDLTASIASEVGSLLARIHSHRATGYGDLTKPESLNLDPRIYFIQKFEEEIAECRHHLPKRMIEDCRHYHDAHIHLLTRVDGPCIVHRDFRPGNLIINEGKVKGIIDWASGRAGFAEQDFCSIEHSGWFLYPEIKSSFLSGYASIRGVPHYTNLIPLLCLGRALGVIGFVVKQGTWDNSHKYIYDLNLSFLESFF